MTGRVFIPEHEKDVIYYSNADPNCLQLFYEVLMRAPEFVQNTVIWKCIDTDAAAAWELYQLPCWTADIKPGVPTMVIRRPGAERGIFLGTVDIGVMLRQRVGRR